MIEQKDYPANLQQQPAVKRTGSLSLAARWVISGMVLALFFGALLYEYWADLAAASLRIVNSARTTGAVKIDSQYFRVLNNSSASPERINEVLRLMENQYRTITTHTGAQPSRKIPVLFTNGAGPSLTDGAQIVINNDDGIFDTDLVPIFLVWYIEEIPVNPQKGLVQAGGYALYVIEAAGLGDGLARQPLDDWVILLRRSDAYLPLEEAWQTGVPSDEKGAYRLMRAVLETGSFLKWLASTYGIEAAQRAGRGETVEPLTGRPLADLEAQWLAALEEQVIEPEDCTAVIPHDSVFTILCDMLVPVNE